KNNSTSNLDLFKTESRGTIAGEGAAFFLLTDKPSGKDYAELKALHTFYKPVDLDEIKNNIRSFLFSTAVNMQEIDLVITGRNGDPKNDKVYKELQQSLFAGKVLVDYKHLCGEYPTSSAFACWLAANILKSGNVPGLVEKKRSGTKLKNVLIYNHYQDIHHSVYLLSAC
ncbi:MAG: 3-oxoacyl-(acyl carrier protein) synthase, partial [Chitinophagaceae bacterium]|nr:3-oxoacyl-(acyl carrier protein) synthase [Chitinophagaceae bacterium]